MSRSYSKKVPEKWITFPHDEEVKLLITPFSVTDLMKIPSADGPAMSVLLDVFVGAVKDWKGVIDKSTNKVMKCNKDTRESIAKQDNELLTWSNVEIKQFTRETVVVTDEEVKN